MRTIAITINKGGVGKTMLTKTLATAATAAGMNVLVLDMDTQQNATTWGRRRRTKQQEKPLPLARFITEHDLSEELQRAESAGCDLVLIDTPPGRSSEAPAAVEAADLVLIPFWNDQDAYEGAAKTAVLARRMGKTAFGVLNFATPNSRTHEDTARTVLQAIPLPMAPVILHRYDVHRVANINGLTAQEMEPESIAADEIAALWGWLSAVLQLSTSAPVHKGEA
jgi:chromosome partitioning protein